MSAPRSASEQFRQSHGLEQFFASLGERSGLNVLDLGEFTQNNVVHITMLGHRLFVEDLLQSVDSIFGVGDPNETQASPEKVREFLDQILQFEEQQFDGILVWGVLEHLSRPLLGAVLERLKKLLRPHGAMFACFHAEARGLMVEKNSFRIIDSKTVTLAPRGLRRAAQVYNNRAIEKLFDGFQSVKFFLTRDYIREVIVRN